MTIVVILYDLHILELQFSMTIVVILYDLHTLEFAVYVMILPRFDIGRNRLGSWSQYEVLCKMSVCVV